MRWQKKLFELCGFKCKFGGYHIILEQKRTVYSFFMCSYLLDWFISMGLKEKWIQDVCYCLFTMLCTVWIEHWKPVWGEMSRNKANLFWYYVPVHLVWWLFWEYPMCNTDKDVCKSCTNTVWSRQGHWPDMRHFAVRYVGTLALFTWLIIDSLLCRYIVKGILHSVLICKAGLHLSVYLMVYNASALLI